MKKVLFFLIILLVTQPFVVDAQKSLLVNTTWRSTDILDGEVVFEVKEKTAKLEKVTGNSSIKIESAYSYQEANNNFFFLLDNGDIMVFKIVFHENIMSISQNGEHVANLLKASPSVTVLTIKKLDAKNIKPAEKKPNTSERVSLFNDGSFLDPWLEYYGVDVKSMRTTQETQITQPIQITPISTQKLCYACHGTGSCVVCKGSGYYSIYGNGGKCTSCAGGGKCHRCNGTRYEK